MSSLLPVLLIQQLNVPVADGHFPLAGRWLASSTAAAATLLGIAFSGITWVGVRRMVGFLVALWSLVSLARSGVTCGVYRDQNSLMRVQDEIFLATPAELRTKDRQCDFVERQVVRLLADKPQQALDALDGRVRGCPTVERFQLLQLRALVDLGRHSEAYPVATALLQGQSMEPRYHTEAYYLAGVAAEATGHLRLAEVWLRSARDLGNPSCNLPVTLGRLLASTSRVEEAASEYQRAADCSPNDARSLLAAVSLWLRAKNPRAAAAALAAARLRPMDATQRDLAQRLENQVRSRPD
jgi:tetratricopeptide (TPR) repeat protein